MFDFEGLRYDLIDWINPEPPDPRVERLAEEMDRGEYEINMHKVDSALDEAHQVFIRTGVSSMLKAGDVVVGVHNRDGDLVSASCGTYLHGPIAQLPVKFLINEYVEGDSNVEINPGDIFYTNEALTGGLHNPDQMAIMPVFNDGELIAWASAALHQGETGAIEPGGMAQSARTRYDEGMRLTPIKIGEDYEIRDDLMDMMVNFILRAPQMQETDVRARATATDVVRKRIQGLAEETGNDFVHGLFRKAITTAEVGSRNLISEMTDGTYRSVGFFDNVGAEEALMKISLELRKEGDELTLDFSGTSPEAGSLNSFAHGVAAYISSYLYPYVFYDLPVSTGAFAPFNFEIPDRSVLNASPEASVSQCVIAGTVVLARCHDVFGQMLYSTHPERVAGAPDAHEGGGGYSGINKYGVKVADMVTFNMNTMGAGARVDRDGMDAHGFSMGPWGKATNMEEDEEDGIFLPVERGFLADTGGFGKYRGGNGTQNVNVVVSDHEVSAFRNGKGTRIPSNTGLFGGYAEGSLLGLRITDADLMERLESGEHVPRDVREIVSERAIDGDYHFEPVGRESRTLEKGDVFVRLMSGGGGLGDPLERDPEAVAEDRRHGMISEWAAENVFCVATEDGDLDAEATERRREEERAERLERGRPFEEFQDEWHEKRPDDDLLEHYGQWPEGLIEGEPTPAPADD